MKGFGIAALVLSIVAIFIPIVGVFIAGISGFLAIFSARHGMALGLAAVIINLVNIALLSPSLLIAANQQSVTSGGSSYTATFAVLVCIQVLAIVVFVVSGIKARQSTPRNL